MCALDKLTAMYGDGSTASVVYIPDSLQSIHVATLGDSPVIWKNRNGCEQAPEHNVRTNDKERLEAEKRGGHFDGIYICRGGLGLQMSRSLGDRYLRGVVIQTPDIVEDHLLRNSWVVVASDGIYTNEGEKQRMIQRLEMGADAEDLVKFALAIPYNRDNVTAIVFRIGEKRGKSRSNRGAEVGTSSRRPSRARKSD